MRLEARQVRAGGLLEPGDLRRAQVADHRDVRGGLPHHAEGPVVARVLQRLALASHAQGDPGLLADAGQAPVDGQRPRVAAGHAGDHQRHPQPPSEKRRGKVDLGETQLRKGVVLKCPLLEPGRLPAEADVLLQRQGDVLSLAGRGSRGAGWSV